ncbi:MAG TPA: hypothetical protein VM029_02625, partial [Opitutaceae bacterium]|nr:hypothetical protein [Opitutaceae bacterium]
HAGDRRGKRPHFAAGTAAHIQPTMGGYVPCFMNANASDPILQHQLQSVKQIIDDETWLEGERRGCPVAPDDRVVRENVCRIVLRVGQQMRQAAMAFQQKSA